MSSIFKISEALKTHLSRGHSHSVELEDPSDTNVQGKVSVWLYQVQADEFSRNATSPVLTEGGASVGGTLSKRTRSSVPPYGANLHYLVTPLMNNVESNQETLGRMLLTIHESPFLSVPDPQSGQDEQVRLILPTDTLEDRARLWDLLQSKTYHLCFTCVVRTARLFSSLSLEEAPVLSLSSVSSPQLAGGS